MSGHPARAFLVLLSSMVLAGAWRPAAAQDAVQLSFFPKPGQVIAMETRSRMATEVDLQGDELRRRGEANGARLPMKLLRTDSQRMRTTTGALGADGSFPLALEFVSAESRTVDAEGREVPLPSATGSLVGGRMLARARPPRQVEFLSFEGVQMKPEFQALLPQVMKGVFSAMEQLESVTVRPGEPATQRMDMQIPMPQGMPPLQLAGQAVYTLQGVEGGIARFGITLAYRMDQRPGAPMQVQAEGTGRGTMQYDVTRQLMTAMETDSRFRMALRVPGGAIVQDMQLQQSVTQAPQ